MKFQTDIVIIDLEASCKTFGHNTIEESNIIEIGAVRLDRKDLSIKAEFSQLIRPRDYPILPGITEITSISPEMVADQPEFAAAAEQFVEWYGKRNKAILASFGIYYDLPLLRKEFRVFGLDYGASFVGGGVDIRSLAYLWLAKNNRSTSGIKIASLLEKMDLAADFQFHRALDDAKATAAIFRKIVEEIS